ncbi:hypothetical protein [Falsiroseomonas sp.]|uniref:hypothetical protein n=1 Tax=Falsiroseomonas sp. TaxID=2870721 RepID=UPI003F6E99BF
MINKRLVVIRRPAMHTVPPYWLCGWKLALLVKAVGIAPHPPRRMPAAETASPVVHAGLRFGRLTVLHEDEPYVWRGRVSRRRWCCECVCGRSVTVRDDSLKRGHTASCGCLRDDETRSRTTRHGGKTGTARLPEYEVWQSVLHRRGGARVCARWCQGDGIGFVAFLRDMGRRPSPAHSLVRRDETRAYSPINCLWSTQRRRRGIARRVIKVGAATMTLKEAADSIGVAYATLCKRLQRGWTVDAALGRGVGA